MVDVLLLIAAAIAALAGFSWLALGMETHWAQVHGAVPHRSRKPRIGGAAALALSLALCLSVDHPTMAVLVWFMLLAGAAVAVAMTLSSRPQWLRQLWPASAKP